VKNSSASCCLTVANSACPRPIRADWPATFLEDRLKRHPCSGGGTGKQVLQHRICVHASRLRVLSRKQPVGVCMSCNYYTQHADPDGLYSGLYSQPPRIGMLSGTLKSFRIARSKSFRGSPRAMPSSREHLTQRVASLVCKALASSVNAACDAERLARRVQSIRDAGKGSVHPVQRWTGSVALLEGREGKEDLNDGGHIAAVVGDDLLLRGESMPSVLA
jgi:hypothetical protein